MKYDEYTSISYTTNNLKFNVDILNRNVGKLIKCTIKNKLTLCKLFEIHSEYLLVYDLCLLTYINVYPEHILLNSSIVVIDINNDISNVKIDKISYTDFIIGNLIFDDTKLITSDYLIMTNKTHNAFVKVLRITECKTCLVVQPLSENSIIELNHCLKNKQTATPMGDDENKLIIIEVSNILPEVEITHLSETDIINFSKDFTKESECNKFFDFAQAVKYLLDGYKVRCHTWLRHEYVKLNTDKDALTRIITDKGHSFDTNIWQWSTNIWELYEEGK